MNNIYIKIKKAREMLKLTQVAVADLSGVSQRNISDMENGIKKFIPNEYIQFLHINGIDINSIFDDSFDVKLKNSIKGDNNQINTIGDNINIGKSQIKEYNNFNSVGEAGVEYSTTQKCEELAKENEELKIKVIKLSGQVELLKGMLK